MKRDAKDSTTMMSQPELRTLRKTISPNRLPRHLQLHRYHRKNDDELEKKLKELEARLDAEDSKKVQADLLKKVTAAMKAKQANDDYVLSKTLQGVTFDTKKTVDELVTEFLPKYDAEYKACRGYGTAPRTSDGSGGTQHNAASRYFERKGKKEGWKKN